MAKVKFKLNGTLCGPEGNKFAGDVIEVDEKEAERLHLDGQGEVVKEEAKEPKKQEASKSTATDKRATASKQVAVSTGGKK